MYEVVKNHCLIILIFSLAVALMTAKPLAIRSMVGH